MKRYLSIAIFFALAIVVWWNITDEHSDNELERPKSARFIEIFMNNFEMTAMDDNGAPLYIMRGEHLQRYNDSTETEITSPIFHLLQDKGQWLISADTAIVNDEDETIRLHTNVVMLQQQAEPAVTIKTQNLLIHTKKQIAQTEDDVEITQGGSQLNSKGMIFNNLTSVLELSSNVSGHYLPHD